MNLRHPPSKAEVPFSYLGTSVQIDVKVSNKLPWVTASKKWIPSVWFWSPKECPLVWASFFWPGDWKKLLQAAALCLLVPDVCVFSSHRISVMDMQQHFSQISQNSFSLSSQHLWIHDTESTRWIYTSQCFLSCTYDTFDPIMACW